MGIPKPPRPLDKRPLIEDVLLPSSESAAENPSVKRKVTRALSRSGLTLEQSQRGLRLNVGLGQDRNGGLL